MRLWSSRRRTVAVSRMRFLMLPAERLQVGDETMVPVRIVGKDEYGHWIARLVDGPWQVGDNHVWTWDTQQKGRPPFLVDRKP